MNAATTLNPTTMDKEGGIEDDFRHIVCCMDSESRTYCGLPGSSLRWFTTEPPCVVCDAMETETDLCPSGGLCVMFAMDAT